MCICVFLLIFASICDCMSMRMCVYLLMCVRVCVDVLICASMCDCMSMCICVCLLMCVHVPTYVTMNHDRY